MKQNTDKGFVKLQRNMLEWEWYQDNHTMRLMLHILLKVNYTSKKWQGITINPGEMITSINNLSKELCLSENIIRTALKKLKKTGYIITQSTNKFTKIKLLKSTIYNDSDFTNNEPKNYPSVNESLSNDKPITTTNKVKKEIDIIERKEVFKKQIFQFQNQFSKEALNNFYNYWTEENRQTGRLKFEDEKYWNLESRLHNWKQFKNIKTEKQKINLNR